MNLHPRETLAPLRFSIPSEEIARVRAIPRMGTHSGRVIVTGEDGSWTIPPPVRRRPEPGRPRLSVVIPVHNGGRDFERCLRRLRESAWTDFELLVVDDGSTDRSGALALEYGARVITHETPRGPAAARNNGALSARTPIIFFLDADVALHPDAPGTG